MKEEILNILGKNHTNTIEFISVNNYSEVYGLYTYKGDVYTLKEGQDIPFDELTEKEQTKITSMVLSKQWKINKSLQ
jgi:hypothetical protein